MEVSESESISELESLPDMAGLNSLIDLTKNCEFFKKLIEEQQSAEIHKMCCDVMNIQKYSKGEMIIRYGDIATDFYIIIKGHVGIYIPRVRRSTILSQNASDLQKSLLRVKRVSIFQHTDINSNDFSERLSNRFVPIADIRNLEKVLIMGPGESFGELALINNKPRAATVLATTNVTLAVLSKKSFKALIEKFSERKLNEKLNFFQSHPMFDKCSKVSLMKISFYFKLVKVAKGQFLFKSGDVADGLYFVKSGEFLVKK